MKISVVIPVYNVAPYIEQCLCSIMAQTIDDMEVLIVDDCGTDDSISIAKKLISEYTGNKIFKILQRKNNGGLSAARNTGIDAAKGDYITFVDSDDYIAPMMYEKLLQTFSANDNVGITSCLPLFINENGQYVNDAYTSEVQKIVEAKDFFVQWFTSKIWHTAWGKLYKKDLFENVRFCEGINNEDIRLCIDMYKTIEAKKYNLVEIPEKLYFYRQREGSITKEVHIRKKNLNFDIVTNNYIGVLILQHKDVDEYSKYIRAFCRAWWGIILQVRQYEELRRYYAHYQKMAKIIPDDVASTVLSKYGSDDYMLFRQMKYHPIIDRIKLTFVLIKMYIKKRSLIGTF